MIAYKDMSIEDIDALSALYAEAFNAPPWNDEWTAETAAKRLRQMILAPGFYGLCAYRQGALCGMILGSKEQFYNGMMFHIREFCVKPSLRGQGIGTQILSDFEDRLRREGVKSVWLLTSRQDGTEGFYERRGLKPYKHMVMMGKRF